MARRDEVREYWGTFGYAEGHIKERLCSACGRRPQDAGHRRNTNAFRGAIMNVNLRGIFCLLILFATGRVALSQVSNVTGSGVVTGVVKLGDAPAAGITLALLPERMGPMAQQPDITNRAVTDEKGEYRFMNVAAGRFLVTPLAEAFVITSV